VPAHRGLVYQALAAGGRADLPGLRWALGSVRRMLQRDRAALDVAGLGPSSLTDSCAGRGPGSPSCCQCPQHRTPAQPQLPGTGLCPRYDTVRLLAPFTPLGGCHFGSGGVGFMAYVTERSG
jgi:hypothetical protein